MEGCFNCESSLKLSQHLLDVNFPLPENLLKNLSPAETAMFQSQEKLIEIILASREADYLMLREINLLNLKKLGSPSADKCTSFVPAELYLHMALADLQFGYRFRAIRNFRSAHRIYSQNLESDSGCILNNRGMAVIEGIFSALPESWRKWVDFFTGISGDRDKAIQLMEELLRAEQFSDPLIAENHLVAIHLFFSLREHQLSLRTMEDFGCLGLSGRMSDLLQLRVLLGTHNSKKAAEFGFDCSDPFLKNFPLPAFYSGIYHLYQLQSEAEPCFRSFLQNWDGNNYRRETWQKISWLGVLNDNPELISEGREKMGYDGSVVRPQDQAAHSESVRPVPDRDLLMARILFDAGRLEEALMTVENAQLCAKTESVGIRFECFYRKGRILQGMGRTKESLQTYILALGTENVDQSSFVFVNTLLQAAILSEKAGDQSDAKVFFNRVLDASPDEYSDYFRDQAITGLQRLTH